MKTKLLSILLSALLPTWLSAQSIVLQAYIEEGLQNNLQLKSEQLLYERSMESLTQARALFMPQVSAQAAYTLADGGRRIQFPVGDLLNPVYATLNQLTGTNNFPTISNVDEQLLPNNFHDTKLRVIQPLFNPDIYFNYKAQKELISAQQAQKNAYANELEYNISGAYFKYLQSEEAILIYEQSKAILEELNRVNRSLFAVDKITKDVLLNTEYELAKLEQKLTEAQKDNELAHAYFNFLLNKELNTPIIKDSLLSTHALPILTVEELTAQALEQRAEIKQVESGLRVNEQVVKMNRARAFMPNLVAVGDLGYQGFGYNFDQEQQYYMVQFSLSWDLFKGGEKKSKTRQAQIDYEILENKYSQLQKQIGLQITQSFRELETAQKSLDAAIIGEASATKAFQIIKSKYENGQALYLEYSDAQNKLVTAQLAKIIANYQLLDKEAALQKTLSTI